MRTIKYFTWVLTRWLNTPTPNVRNSVKGAKACYLQSITGCNCNQYDIKLRYKQFMDELYRLVDSKSLHGDVVACKLVWHDLYDKSDDMTCELKEKGYNVVFSDGLVVGEYVLVVSWNC